MATSPDEPTKSYQKAGLDNGRFPQLLFFRKARVNPVDKAERCGLLTVPIGVVGGRVTRQYIL